MRRFLPLLGFAALLAGCGSGDSPGPENAAAEKAAAAQFRARPAAPKPDFRAPSSS